MFPDVGGELGPYKILGELGGGGMTRVYRAWDERLHREVAIKVIDDRLARKATMTRFLAEARAASGLNHPNICTIFDVGEHNGCPYLVTELLDGRALSERISRRAIPVEEILRYSTEIADALAAAHARGVVHGRITPASILLVNKPVGPPQTKVLDFGLSRIGANSDPGSDLPSPLPGTDETPDAASYTSPEQARGELPDARSDLFSLGAVMYEMATGRVPFRGNTSALVFVQLLGQMLPDPVRRLNPQMPAELERIVMKLLAKSPRARFQSATELTDELQELAEQRSGWLVRVRQRMAAASAPSDARARTGRNSIATQPRISFPAVAPYPGRSGSQRPLKPEGPATEPSGFGKVTEIESAAVEGDRVAWWRLVVVLLLAVALIALLGGLLTWRLGWTAASAR